MLIVLDGQPGAGKTTLLSALAKKGYQTIGEVVTENANTLDGFGRDIHDIYQSVRDMPFVLQSDLIKHSRAAACSRDQVVIMDRNYIFTLAVALLLGKTLQESLYLETVTWFYSNRDTLIRPDAYIILDIPAKLSDERIGWSKRNPGNPMTFIELRLQAAAYCEAFRYIHEPTTPIVRIDAQRPTKHVLATTLSAIASLNGGGPDELRAAD